MTSILLQSVSKVANAEVEKRNQHFAAAQKFFSEARDAAERGDASASGQLILRGLEQERKAGAVGPQVMQLIKPRR